MRVFVCVGACVCVCDLRRVLGIRPDWSSTYYRPPGRVYIRKQIDAAEAGLASWLHVYRSNGDGLKLLALPRHEVKACHSGAWEFL